ncbi:MAG: tRNA (adenosine(37)-N6)-dimethylallyltransferase MiaA [Gemmatimonadales bacterium]
MAGVRVPVIVGPTAVGKTAVALALGALWPLEVISADSRQIYTGLDVATAKPSRRELARVPHHGLDLVRPGERYSAGRFARDGIEWILDVQRRGRLPVVVGGTGLYVRALMDGLFLEPPLDPDRRRAVERWVERLDNRALVRWAGRLDTRFQGGGRQRAARAVEVALLSGRSLSYWQEHARAESPVEPWYVVLTVPRAVLHRRIAARAHEMVRRGLVEEVAAVLAEGCPPDGPGLDAVGVREAVEYLHGVRDRESVLEAIIVATRQYAKRQETWFRHQPRGPILTLDATGTPETLAQQIADAWAADTDRPDAARGGRL